MTKWWKHVALLGAWLALGATAKAQPGYPSPVGAARMVEPLRYTPEPQPDLVPGPMTPQMAPVGPPSTLNLPADHTGAFQLENYPAESAGFGSIGGMSLQRQKLTHLPIAFTDNQSRGLDTGIVPTGIGTLPTGGFNPFMTVPSLLPKALDLNDINPAWSTGGRLTIGYLLGNSAVELTGFYDPNSSSNGTVGNQGRLFVPFGPSNKTLLGFEGNNGLFLQADRVQTTFSNEIASAELNFRTWDAGINRTELILGMRYFYSRERIDINTDDEFSTKSIFGAADPRRQANYGVSTRNNLVAAQFGGEYSAPLPTESLSWIWLTMMGKGAVGPNFIETNRSLTRGDGFVGFNAGHSTVRVSGLSELSGFVDFHLLDRVRLRAGYTALYGFNFSTAGALVQYDLTRQAIGGKDHNSVFWHGPVAELQFLF
jgi:hypothetical protein